MVDSLESASVPVQPNAMFTACNREVDAVPVRVAVTFVSSVLVSAAGVTVLGAVLAIVKLGYVPVTAIPVPLFSTTVWSGAVLVTLIVPDVVTGFVPPTLIPVPADRPILVTVPDPPLPLLAAVILPSAPTLMLAAVYDPAVTPELLMVVGTTPFTSFPCTSPVSSMLLVCVLSNTICITPFKS